GPATRRPGGGAGCALGAGGFGEDWSRFLDARQAPSVVRDYQPPAHGNGARGKDTASFDQGQLRRAAADINVEQRRVVPARKRNRTRPMRRHLAFHVMPGGGADEFAGFLGKKVRDGAGVASLARLAPHHYAS